MAEQKNSVAEEKILMAEQKNPVAEQKNFMAERKETVAEEKNLMAEEKNPAAEQKFPSRKYLQTAAWLVQIACKLSFWRDLRGFWVP